MARYLASRTKRTHDRERYRHNTHMFILGS